ncbi:MAG: acyl-CoA dehydratase activase-related protein, partial [Ruminococcus sp.]
LNFFDLLPFWHTFFSELGFNIIVSPDSDRELYVKGQNTITSDTICYPAKLMHGHLEWLIREQPDAIFYPDMSYNIDEKLGVDHYNCPVVAYYPQVLKMNMPSLAEIPFICDFISISDKKQFERRIADILQRYFHKFSTREIHNASAAAFIEYDSYRKAVREQAAEYVAKAKENNMPVIVLCGRPYHLDPEVNHGIDKLLCELGSVVITEDAISGIIAPFETGVRNQWTYHARMYSAAKYIAETDITEDMHLVQLVSFGCGVDAITTDEVRSILEEHGRDYTQIKIDEISNMGAVTIRMRSLLAMLEEKRRAKS